jgi:hypothetical protein
MRHVAETLRSAGELSNLIREFGHAINVLIERYAPTSPAQFTGNQNNYDIGDAWVLRVSTDASRNFTGFLRGARGRWLIFLNVGAQPAVIQNQNAGSDAANRVITGTGADVTVAADGSATLLYDEVTGRWRKIS